MSEEHKTRAEQSSVLTVDVENSRETHLEIDEIRSDERPYDIPASKETVIEVNEWITRHREKTRTNITERLMTFFGCTLVATFVLMTAAAFNPNADKPFVKDLASMATTAQVGFLGTVLGYYFGAKEK